MQRPTSRSQFSNVFKSIALVVAALLVPWGPYGGVVSAQSAPQQPPGQSGPQQPAAQSGQKPATGATEAPAEKIPNDQLDSLVAPIALYPDPLLSQTLVASTYPLEIVQLQQWLVKNKNLKDKALTDAVAKQPWDPSIQSMAALPDVVKRLSDDIQWTTDLGNAFLAQQGDVMDAVQRMRKKAQGTGALASNEQQKVETKVVEQKTVIVVEQANPEVVYVPSYSPVVVYGPPVYPYPPIYYPVYPPGYVAATAAISFGVGIAIGAAWGGGGWGYGCGWGGNNVNINVNNNFVRNSNINRNSNTWNHDVNHRGGAPYGNRATADRYGGTARGDSLSSRQSGGARSPQASSASRSPSSSTRSTSAGAGSSGGGDRVGSREVPRSSSSSGGGSGAFSGSSGGGNRAAASSSRGGASRGGGGGGGGRRR